MKRSSLAAIAAALALAACSGAGHSTLPNTGSPGGGGTTPQSSAVSTTFKLTIPGPTNATASARKPAYVSSATKTVKFVLNSSSTLTANQVSSFNDQGTFSVASLPSTACPSNGAGGFNCTFTVLLPPGSDNVTVTLTDGATPTPNVLSQQILTLSVTPGVNNSFSVTFDANASALALSGSGSCENGPIGSVFGSTGTTAVAFSSSYTDPATKAIVGPGLPSLQILGNDATYHADSGTINGTGGTVAFTINQSSQTFSLTPSTSTVTNATVAVKAVPANSTGSSDGLSFSLAKSFVFSTGPAPPAHAFLAAVEQTGAASGKIDFYTVTVGAAGQSDALTAFSQPSLTVTNSTNENKPDVDNPETLHWDKNGDLLIGNADDGGINHGNLACVPAGAIVTGANTATTTSSNVSSPVGLAYDTNDGSVAIANTQPAATYNLSEYLLSGNYVAAPGARNLKYYVANVGATAVTDLSNLTAGTYAVALSDGIETDPAHGGGGTESEIAILSPSGAETDIAAATTGGSAYAVDKPSGLAFDAANNQLVISNSSSFHKNVSFYTIAAGPTATLALVKNTGERNFEVATSPDGHVAVAWNTPFGDQQVQVYDNTAARNAVGGPIPYNAVVNAASCNSASPTYIYGNNTVIATSLTWLSNAKLLVSVEAPGSATNGLYVYDISRTAVPAGVDDDSCNAFAAAPVQTAFQAITNKPLATAYKP